MIFDPHTAKLIRQGKVTMTRRRVRDREPDCRYKPGRAYTVQTGARGAASTRITITDVHREALGAITLKDAHREGCRTTAEFIDRWIELHGAWTPDVDVWVISFALGDTRDMPRLLRAAAPKAPICTARAKRPDGRTKACGRAFADDQETCRCGAKRPPATAEDHGYTTRPSAAMREEGEAVPADVQKTFSEKAAERDAALRLAKHRRLSTAIGSIRAEAVRLPHGDLDPLMRKKLKSAIHKLEEVQRSLDDTPAGRVC